MPSEEANTSRPSAGLLLPILERASRRAGTLELEGRLPTASGPCLVRGSHGLEVAEEEWIDWRLLTGELTREREVWEAVAAAAEALKSDQEIETEIGWADGTMRAQALWSDVVMPLFRQHRREAGEWKWKEGEAEELLGSWRDSHGAGWRERCCRAPLHNCRSMVDEVVIHPDLVIRRLSDAERDALWRRHGAEVNPGPHRPTVADIESWELVIDYRWKRKASGPDEQQAINVVRDLVRALRLHHHGMSGTSILWFGPDPDLRWEDNSPASMFAPPETSTDGFGGQLECHLGPASGEDLTTLYDRLRRPLTSNLSLVLDRFDSAYSRQAPQDQLIDLWVALEALVLPDIREELRFRSSLRLAHLVGDSAEKKQEVFNLACDSYVCRSKVVHGSSKAKELGPIVQETRMLAVDALRKWLLDPPEDGVATLDLANFG
jgi:hypothetical protein